MDRFNGRKREHTERGAVKQNTKMSEVSGQESKGYVDYSTEIHNQTKEKANYTLSKSLMPEASLSTRVKQEIDVDNEGKSLEKMREMCRQAANTEGADHAFASTLRRTRESRARRREEDNSNIVRGLKNATNVGCKEKVETFWFSLVASNNQKSKAPLEQIPSRYLRLKDGNITVSSIKKYLMQKLNLRSENEVEISLQGRLLLPNLQIRKLVDMWLHTSPAAERKTAFVGSSAHDFVLILTYARRPQSAST